ncbi:hypothetical protein ACVW2L_002028 [Mucilaginibacter sp. HD30]
MALINYPIQKEVFILTNDRFVIKYKHLCGQHDIAFSVYPPSEYYFAGKIWSHRFILPDFLPYPILL